MLELQILAEVLYEERIKAVERRRDAAIAKPKRPRRRVRPLSLLASLGGLLSRIGTALEQRFGDPDGLSSAPPRPA